MDDMPDAGLWLSLSDLARGRGVSKQALAKRVERLERLGHLITRPGPRGSKLVNAAAFDRAAGSTVDAVRQLNGKGAPLEPVPAPPAMTPADPVLAREQARRAAYDADLKKLDLLERLGVLVPVDDLRGSAGGFAGPLIRTLDSLPAKADALLEAARGGHHGAHSFLADLGRELRNAIADACEQLARAAEAEPPRSLDDIEVPTEKINEGERNG